MTTRTQRLAVNALTLGRLPFVLLFMLLAVLHARTLPHKGLCAGDWLAVAAVLLLIFAALTDLFDGKLARKWKVVSKFGAMADPLMDKVFYLVVFPVELWISGAEGGLGTHSLLLLFLTIVYSVRDQWVTFLRSVASGFDAYCGAMWIGKFRTAFTFPAAIFIYLWLAFRQILSPWIPLSFVYALEWILAGVTLWTLVSYTKAYWPYVKKALG